jgi:nitrogen-specific signal transduction histidine kinase
MNLNSINYKFFADSDLNPFIIFNQNSKILYLNYSAEMLLGHVDKREIFDIALVHAPKNYGTKTTNKEFVYNHLSYYAINVSYENEEIIGIRFYEKPKIIQSNDNISKFKKTDIHLLLEAAILQFKAKSSAKLFLIADYEIPEFLLAQNDLSKILRKTFEALSKATRVTVTLKMKVGEYRLISGKKQAILKLQIEYDHPLIKFDKALQTIAKSVYIDINIYNNKMTMLIPMIKSK